ncbi:MAG TPA: DUF72 domain-containing protein [Silvibacterium sp.]|nr:DUF72 domain-containing protein [Silvibacterium sp.]
MASKIKSSSPVPGMVRIGISGWRYKGWRGVFYPPKLAQRRELEFASREFSTIEINGSFYSLQRPESFARWKAETPTDFVFSVKGSRYITHLLKLKKIEKPLANFFAQGLLQLGEKLGPILWQFPPVFKYDRERFAEFFRQLPRTTREAAKLARSHDERMNERSFTRAGHDRPLRHCVEIRHESCVAPDFVDLLREHNIGLVVADTVEWPLLMDVTSDFVYCRLHGSEQLYASGYEEAALETWAARVAAWARGGESPDGRFAHSERSSGSGPRDVYVYFDNDAKVRAPFDAKKLGALVAKRLASA